MKFRFYSFYSLGFLLLLGWIWKNAQKAGQEVIKLMFEGSPGHVGHIQTLTLQDWQE